MCFIITRRIRDDNFARLWSNNLVNLKSRKETTKLEDFLESWFDCAISVKRKVNKFKLANDVRIER